MKRNNPFLNLSYLNLGFIICSLIIFFLFIRLPKQAFVQGVVEAWLVSKGLIFYKDIMAAYTPLLRMLMVPLHQIAGYSQSVTISLYPITAISILMLLYVVSRKWIKGVFGVVTLFFYTLWFSYSGANHFTATSFLGLTVLVQFIFWRIWFVKRDKKFALLTGLLGSVNVLSLRMLLPYVLILLISLAVFSLRGKDRESIVYCTVGFIVPIFVVLMWFYSNNALYHFFRWNVFYYFQDYPYADFGKSTKDTLIFFVIHSPLVLFGLLKSYRIKSKSRKSDMVLNGELWIILLSSLTLPVLFWFALFHPLRFQISIPLFSLILGMLLTNIQTNKLIPRLVVIGLFIFNFYLLFNIVFPETYKALISNRGNVVVSQVQVTDPMFDAVKWVQDNTESGSRLFVIGDILFYLDSRRLPSSARAMVTEPFGYEPIEEFKLELKQSSPDYWVVDTRKLGRFDQFGFSHTSNLFRTILSSQDKVARFDYWEIYKTRSLESCL